MWGNTIALLIAISILGTLRVSAFGQGVCCAVFSDLANERRGDRLLWGTVVANQRNCVRWFGTDAAAS